MGCNILTTCLVFVIVTGMVEAVITGINYVDDKNEMNNNGTWSPTARRLRVPATAFICASVAWSLVVGVTYCLVSHGSSRRDEAERERRSIRLFSIWSGISALLWLISGVLYHQAHASVGCGSISGPVNCSINNLVTGLAWGLFGICLLSFGFSLLQIKAIRKEDNIAMQNKVDIPRSESPVSQTTIRV